MTDEQRVRSALEYELEPWQPDPADLMRRGRRLAWLRRGLAAAGVTALAGTVATVSAAVGGPARDVRSLLAGGGKPSVPVAVPSVPTPSVDPTCLPSVVRTRCEVEGKLSGQAEHPVDPAVGPDGKADAAGQAHAAEGADDQAVAAGQADLPSIPTSKPTLPGKPTLPTVPTTKPTLPGKPTLPPVPTTKPTLPAQADACRRSRPPKPSLPGKPAVPPVPTAMPSVPAKPR